MRGNVTGKGEDMMRKNIQDMTMPKVVEKGQSDYATAPPICTNSANLEFSENEIPEKTQDQETLRDKIGRRLEKIVPPGSDLKSVKKIFIAFCIVFLGSGIISFLLTYGLCYADLFETTQYGKFIIPGVEMPDINYIISGKFKGIYVMLALGIVLIMNNCRSFISETKSIYVMMRLKSRNELIKRCASLPLILVAVSILIMLLELLIVYLVYILATPPECLPEVISMNIWEALKW